MASAEAKTALPGADRWASFYGAGAGSVYPDENLVRLIRGKYIDVPRGGRALDVGFGTGNNLVMLARSGFEAHGLEVSEPSIARAQQIAKDAGVTLKLGVLRGTRLPYADGFFDIVVSWNAVYYYGDRTQVAAALADFHRVLRPGGALILSVIHPNSFMVRRLAPPTADGRHRIDRDSPHDTRFGLEIFYDGTSSGWRRLLNPFDDVEEGYAECDLFNPDRRDAWRLFVARKQG